MYTLPTFHQFAQNSVEGSGVVRFHSATSLTLDQNMGALYYWYCWELLSYVVRIISRRALREFQVTLPESEQPLLAWYREVKQADWSNPTHVVKRYPNASIVRGNRVVFRTRHNDFRIVARFFYPGRTVFIRFVGTHKEYDRINAEEV